MEHSSNIIHSMYRGMTVSICHFERIREVAVIRDKARPQQHIEVINRWHDFNSLQDALEEARRWIDRELD